MEYALLKIIGGGEPKVLVPTYKQWDNAAKAASTLFRVHTGIVDEELKSKYHDPRSNTSISVCEVDHD